MSRRRKFNLSTAPIAIASDGVVYANFEHSDEKDPRKMLDLALSEGELVFIGIAVAPREQKLIVRLVEDGAAEAVAQVWGPRQRRRLRGARGKPNTTR